jgi:LPXTG-motif cell wall-anchored protein
VLFEVWPPTSNGTAITVPVVAFREPGNGHAAFDGSAPFDSGDDVYIGEDPASGAHAEGLDASVTYDMTDALAAFEAHPQHGWHVKLTINAEGSQGADVKHKVFWTGPCEDTTTTTTSTSTSTSTSSTSTSTSTSTTSTSTTSTSTTSTTLGGTTTTTTGGGGGTTTTTTGGGGGTTTTTLGGQSFPTTTTTTTTPPTTPTSAVLGTSVENTTTTTAPPGAPTTLGAAVAGVQITQGPQVKGVQLARTGDDSRSMLFVAGLTLLLGGAALVAGDKLGARTAS